MSKYHNIKKRCLSGHFHDSKFEAQYCNRLLAMKQKGEIQDYKVQVEFNVAEGIKHRVDFFVVKFEDGKVIQEVHEAKGMWTAVARLKKKLFEQKYPYIPYKVIFQNKRRPRCQRKRRFLLKICP